MTNNRRDFLKTLGIGSATLGLGGVGFSSCSIPSDKKPSLPEQVVEISENGAIVETKFGKIRGYRRNGIYTYKGIPYGVTVRQQRERTGLWPPRSLNSGLECAML